MTPTCRESAHFYVCLQLLLLKTVRRRKFPQLWGSPVSSLYILGVEILRRAKFYTLNYLYVYLACV